MLRGERTLEAMSTTTTELHDGLEGVVAFVTEIAEPDRAGGALRYRGVDLEELAGRVPFERVWGLLVDDAPDPGLPVEEPVTLPASCGDPRVDLQSALARLAPQWSLPMLIDTPPEAARDQLARVSAAALSLTAQAARAGDAASAGGAGGAGRAAGTRRAGGAAGAGGAASVPEHLVATGATAAERFLLRWRGEVDPDHARAIDAYWVSAAEHGMNASTFTARVVASTGTDVASALSAAVGALSGPLHGGAPSRVLDLLDEVERSGDAEATVRAVLDRGDRLMGFGHRIYRAEDPRARVLRRTAIELGARRVEAAQALERAALDELAARKPDRVLATNVEFWSAVVLDHARIPQRLFTALFACSRTAGWSAHVLEQRRRGRLIRPSAIYEGHAARPLPA
jgi:citrate synthase